MIGVVGDGEPGRGHWLFTPAPLYLAFSTADGAEPERGRRMARPGSRPPRWSELTLHAARLRAARRRRPSAARVRGAHHRRRCVRGAALVLTPGVVDPYDGLRRHRDELAARGAAPRVRTRAGSRLVVGADLLRLGSPVLPGDEGHCDRRHLRDPGELRRLPRAARAERRRARHGRARRQVAGGVRNERAGQRRSGRISRAGSPTGMPAASTSSSGGRRGIPRASTRSSASATRTASRWRSIRVTRRRASCCA